MAPAARNQRRTKRDSKQSPKAPKTALVPVFPFSLTSGQKRFANAFKQGNQILNIGYAGTGKTVFAMYLALCEIGKQNADQQKLIIIRSAVATREVGYLPGSLNQKMQVITSLYQGIVAELFDRGDAWSLLSANNQIEVISTSYLRGATYKNAIVLVDECQNLTQHELDTIATRIGENSRLILCGDGLQSDLIGAETSGLGVAERRFNNIEGCSVVFYDENDIVRSGFVKQWLLQIAHEEKQKIKAMPVHLFS